MEDDVRIDKERNSVDSPDHGEVRVGVTPHAFPIGEPFFVGELPDLMRTVTVHTDRNLVRFFLPEFSANDLLVNLLDSPVAVLAGSGDAIPVNARFRIGMRENVVSRVTVGANRGYGQSLTKEPGAVD